MKKLVEELDEIDEFLETVNDAVQVEVWVEMPRQKYDEERKFEFEMLARALNIREVELRVALSNIWLVMRCHNNLWRDRAG